MSSCIASYGNNIKSYVCWDQEKKNSKHLEYEESGTFSSLHIDAMSFHADPYDMNEDYQENLKPKGGYYNFTITEDKITLNYVQNRAYEKYKKAGGKYAKYSQMKSEDFLTAKRYHVVTSDIFTYVFHKKTKKLDIITKPFPNNRFIKSSMQSYKYAPGETHFKVIEHGPVGYKELTKAFGKGKTSRTSFNCEEQAHKSNIEKFIDVMKSK